MRGVVLRSHAETRTFRDRLR